MSNRAMDNIHILGAEDIKLLENMLTYFNEAGQDRFLKPDVPAIDSGFLSENPVFPELNMTWQTIRTLGIGDNSKRMIRQDGYLPEEYTQAARLLSSGNRAFSLVCDGNGGGKVAFRLGISQDKGGGFANSVLSAAFGLADMFPANEPGNASYTWVGSCMPIREDAASLDKIEKDFVPSKWVDAVAASVIGTDCMARMDFSPASDKGWIEDELKKLYEMDSVLTEYLKRHPQVSLGTSWTNSSSQSQNRLFSPRHKSNNDSDSSATSLNISQDFVAMNLRAEGLGKKLRYRIRLLEQIKLSGWLVRLTVTSSFDMDEDAAAVKAAIASAVLALGYTCDWHKEAHKDNPNVSIMLPSYMLPSLISFPTKSFVGFSLKHRSQLNLNPPVHKDADPDSISIGTILWNGADTTLPLCIPRKELNRHAVVFGMTGGGKTNTVCSMLGSLNDLHYLVIEPVKGEYHVLPGVHRYTMVAGEKDSLQMNPFWFPDGSSLQYHIDSLKLIISSAFDLYAAMPNILEQCLYRVYINCGWNLISGQNIYHGELPEDDLYPTFRSLCDEIEHYLNESAFEGETAGNYRGALLSRLQSFTSGAKGMLLNTSKHIRFEQWENQNVVVELDALADDSDKAIVMGAMLVQYFQFIKYSSASQKPVGLKHLFVLEEAHHLFRETQAQINGNANASGQLVSMLNNLLAEIRAYGEGFLIIDQSPSSISTSVLKNTAVKIVHRVDYGEDIKQLQSALLLEEGDHVTASLEQGEALVRFGTMQSPIQVKIPLYLPKEEKFEGRQALAVPGFNDSQDRILSNKMLTEQLTSGFYEFLNFMLFTSDIDKLREAFELFFAVAHQHIIRCCGWDSAVNLNEEGCYIPLLDNCILHVAEEIYPKQYCLQRMIRMFILRIASLLFENKNGGMSEKMWNLLVDYRNTRIYPRISFYFQNESDTTVKMIVAILGSIPEAGVLKQIVDILWTIPRSDAEQFNNKFFEAMDQVFCLPPADETVIYLKELAIRYCNEVSQL